MGKWIGLIAIQDAPKASSKEAIKKLKERGLKTVMLTGIMNGWPKLLLSKWELTPSLLMSFLKKKLAPSKNCKKLARSAFVGDGINDAPAPLDRGLGIAMGSRYGYCDRVREVARKTSIPPIDETSRYA